MAEENREKHPHIRARRMIDRIVLGGSDGIIESIAVTSVLNGLGVEFRTIVLAGFATALAGAISMFFSSYLSEKSERESLLKDMERERMEIEAEPEEEKMELEYFLKKEGYGQKEIDVILNKVTKDKEMWLRAIMRHELHVHADDLKSNYLNKSIFAGISFFLGATISILPYFLLLQHYSALIISVFFSLISLFVLGATKFVTLRHVSFWGGLQMAGIGGVAAFLLYVVGRILGSLT